MVGTNQAYGYGALSPPAEHHDTQRGGKSVLYIPQYRAILDTTSPEGAEVRVVGDEAGALDQEGERVHLAISFTGVSVSVPRPRGQSY